MIENIQELYSRIEHKTNFIKLAAKDLGRSPLTLRQHWFAHFWSIPEEYQPRVVELLQNTIKKQNEKAKASV
jgi:hypothetical protein